MQQRAPARAVESTADLETGWIGWWDPVRRWGWVRSEKGDAFLHWRILSRCGVKEHDLIDERPVKFRSTQSQGRTREVTHLKIV